MKKFLSFISEWQGLWALLAVLFLFFITPRIFEWAGMLSGTIDGAYFQALVFSTGVYFSAIFCGWLSMQFDWKLLDRYSDRDKLLKDWEAITPLQRILIFNLVIFLLISLYILCYFALPKP